MEILANTSDYHLLKIFVMVKLIFCLLLMLLHVAWILLESTVINYWMPPNETIYIHRVGRTARAGSSGRAVSLITDSISDRKLLKEIVKNAQKTNICKHRVVPPEALAMWLEKLSEFDEDYKHILQDEDAEATLSDAERMATTMGNLITYADESKSRPARSWFISETQTAKIRTATRELSGGPEESNNIDKSKSHNDKRERGKNRIVPLVKRPPTRAEKKKKENKTIGMVSPRDFQAAKKKSRDHDDHEHKQKKFR